MPAARTPEIAGRLYLAALGSATSCLTRQRLELTSYDYRPDVLITAAFPRPSRCARHRVVQAVCSSTWRGFAIVAVDRMRFRPRWRAMTERYVYRLLDHDQTELLVYHWQPGAAFAGLDHPHLHVSAALQTQVDATTRSSLDLDKRHLATGRVSLEAVVGMLIAEFAIAPVRHDWRQTLDRVTAALDETPS